MSDMSTLNSSDARAVVTETGRSDAVRKSGNPASASPAEGKTLPAATGVSERAAVREQAAGQDARVERAVAKLNDYVQSFQRDLRFTVDEDLGRPIVRVIDRSTQEVIRQIPNDVTLRLARNLNALEDARPRFPGHRSQCGSKPPRTRSSRTQGAPRTPSRSARSGGGRPPR